MVSGAPPVGLTARFKHIIAGLCGLTGAQSAVNRTSGPFFFLIRLILRRRFGRFKALVARFHAGTLPAPRPSAAPRASEFHAYERPWDPMPRTRAWFWQTVPGAPAYLAQLEQLLADPEMAALLSAAPQAGRLLRPLWSMLSPHPLPAVLRAPPRRRAPRLASPAGPAATGEARTRAVRMVHIPESLDPGRRETRVARRCKFGPLVPG